jgi:hypothetical protein
MDDSSKAALAAAVATGYFLGRTKKGKLAFALATYAAGRRFSLNPQQLLNQALRKIADTPQFAQLNEQLRGELMQPGRAAVSAMADRGLQTLTTALQERTAALREDKPGKAREVVPEEEIGEEAPAAKAAPRKAAPRKAAPRKAAAKKAAAKKTAAKKTAAKKTTSKRPAAKKSSARVGRRR